MNSTIAAGDRIIIRNAPGLLTTDVIGSEVTVVRVEEGPAFPQGVGDEASTYTALKAFFMWTDGSVYYCTEWEQVNPLQAQVDELKAQLQRANERFATRDGQFADSIRIIGEALLEEAAFRDWCAEFDEKIDEVNQQLPVYELPTRRRDFEVTVRITGTMTLTHTFTVEAANLEEAQSIASDCVGNDDLGGSGAESVLSENARWETWDDVDVDVEEVEES